MVECRISQIMCFSSAYKQYIHVSQVQAIYHVCERTVTLTRPVLLRSLDFNAMSYSKINSLSGKI